MSRHLAGFVTVTGSDRRQITFGPADVVPAWAAEQITNPGAWDDQMSDREPLPVAAPVAVRVDPPEGQAPDDEDDDLEPPPHGGPGSGAAAWRDYAAACGVDVAADASREECVKACRAAGVRVD